MAFTSTSKLLSILLLLASFTSKAAGQDCSLCPDGGEIAFPDQVLPITDDSGTTDGTTCAGLAAVVGTIPEADCAANLEGSETFVSFSALCGCTDVAPSVFCVFCGNGDLIDPDRVTSDGFTCGEVAEFAPFAASEEVCSSLVDADRSNCCTNPDPTSCTICSDGSPIGLPDREIVIIEEGFTCADFGQRISFLSEAECADRVGESSGVNYASWCGCAGVEIPDECFLCGPDEEVNSDPDAIFPDSNGLTCLEASQFARHVVDETVCEDVVKPNADLCCSPMTTNSPVVTCQLCPNGGEIAFPDKAIPFLEEDLGVTTCAGLDAVLGGVPEAVCGDTLDSLGSSISFAALCGCTDTSPGICDLCGNGDVIDPDRVIFDSGTCGEFAELAPYAATAEGCTDLLDDGRPACCTNPDPTSCTICPDGSPIGLPDREIVIIEEGFTCADLGQRISFYSEDRCADELGESGVNYASWCGCAGVEIPDECFLCGPDEEVNSDSDAIFPDSNGLTCVEGSQLARHVVNETVCNEVKPIADLCCRPKTTSLPVIPAATESPVAATDSPSAAPTDGSSAPASKFIVALTSGMLMVGTMMMMVA
jgi:hypothetical protein